ncbi:MAG: pentapeptide repeat-containing protein [Parafilimonas sp.]
MERQYFEEQNFDKKDFLEKALPIGDYESCCFNNCNFSNTDLRNIHFIDCVFNGCNMSIAKLDKTVFRDVQFKDCKLLGLLFLDCDSFLFSAGFENCVLNDSSFFKMNLKKMQFKNSTLHEVDFAESDLSNSVFNNCDLLNAKFENTILEKADFRTSFNYSINPEINRIKKAKFSLPAAVGLLDKYDIEIE